MQDGVTARVDIREHAAEREKAFLGIIGDDAGFIMDFYSNGDIYLYGRLRWRRTDGRLKRLWRWLTWSPK